MAGMNVVGDLPSGSGRMFLPPGHAKEREDHEKSVAVIDSFYPEAEKELRRLA